MKDIAIYGFGGLGREVACLISKINEVEPTWNLIGFFDDGVEPGTACRYGSVIGGIEALNTWPHPISVAIAIGTPKYLKSISSMITNGNVDFPNLIAPGVFYFDKDTLRIGKGNIITFGCRFSCDISIGDFNIFDGMISMGHESSVGSFNALFPETRISGGAVIGNGNFFGARSFVAQYIHVGDGTRIGAGSFVLRNTKDGYLYMGNPAKKIEI